MVVAGADVVVVVPSIVVEVDVVVDNTVTDVVVVF